MTELRHDDGEFHSPYSGNASRGADIFDRRLYFVTTEPNETMLAAPGTYRTYPFTGSQDKKKYSVEELTGFVVHDDNLFDVYLGESLAPYVTLEPRKAALPVDRNTMIMPLDHADCDRKEDTQRCKRLNCVVDKTKLDFRMRDRWEIMERLWDSNKGKDDRKSLTQRLNYQNIMINQLDYIRESDSGIVRIAYTTSGKPTAALISDDMAILDTKLYQVACGSKDEAHYLLAIINSLTLESAVEIFMPRGQYGPRHLHKHLWKLSIPKYNPKKKLHCRLVKLGRAAESEAYAEIADMKDSGKPLTSDSVRKRLRGGWQPSSETAAAIENAVMELLE